MTSFAFLLFHFLFAASALAQSYGQNQVIIRDFTWSVRSTEHFDIHYYQDSAHLVPQAAEILERSYERISKSLDAGFNQRRPFFLYANVNDMQQSNIVSVGDGTGGVTEAFKDRFMVYNDGTTAWLDDVITHELTHVFQYAVLVSGFWKSVRILKAFVYPLWMMEGMAEYSTGHMDETTGEVYVRDAATSKGLIPLWKMEHFSHLKPHQITLAYKSGASVMRFMVGQYGPEKVGKILHLFESRFESSSVLQELLGLDIFAFDRKWREYEEERYRRIVRLEKLQEPTVYGAQLTQPASANIPEFNTSPVFTPDGRRMAFISTRDGHPAALVLQDLKTGKRKKMVAQAYTAVENIMMGNFTDVSRILAVSPDGRTLVFSGQKNHVDSLYLYDLNRWKLSKLRLPGFGMISRPAFSPDGGKISFSGMKEGITDIYLVDLKTQKVTPITSDAQDDQSPSFSPDGQSLVYSSEIQVPDDTMVYQRRLYRVRLADLSIERLQGIRGAARDPVFSADGKRILFASEGFGFNDIYELELETGRVTRLTRSIGGSYTPIYTPDGGIAFCSFRRGNIHVYRGARERFLSEVVVTSARPAIGSNNSPMTGGKENGLRPAQVSHMEPRELPGMEHSVSSTAVSVAHAGGKGRAEHASSPPVPGAIGAPGIATSTGTWDAGAEGPRGLVSLSAPRPYKFQASTDLFLPAFFYSSQGGLFWTSYWQGSDMLGHHQGLGQVSYNSGSNYLNYQTGYTYSRYRPQILVGAEGLTADDLLDLSNGLSNNVRNHVQYLGVRYPFDRYHRFELLTAAQEYRQDYPDIDSPSSVEARTMSTSLIRDTANGRYLVATRGERMRAFYVKAAEVLGGSIQNHTAGGDVTKYLPMGSQSAFVLRGMGAESWGEYPQRFSMGGVDGLRGYGSSTVENRGTRFALATAELRFPLVKNLDYYMWYFFPDFYFKAIFGAVFTDAGYAWSANSDVTKAHWNSVRNSVGVGIRIHTFILQLFPFVVQMDYAHRTTSNGGVFYVYLGPLF